MKFKSNYQLYWLLVLMAISFFAIWLSIDSYEYDKDVNNDDTVIYKYGKPELFPSKKHTNSIRKG